MPLLSEDYIIRMINLALAALLRVIGFRIASNYQAAQTLIDHHVEALTGLPARLVKEMEYEALLDALMRQGSLDLGRAYVLGLLLREDALVKDVEKEPEKALLSRIRALNLLLEAELSGDEETRSTDLGLEQAVEQSGEPDEHIEELLLDLEGIDLPDDTLFSLSLYKERRGEFQNAFRYLQDLAYQDPDAGIELEGFCRRMLEKSDTELVHGGMNRRDLQSVLSGG